MFPSHDRWGPCEGGLSVAVWACKPDQVDAIAKWVRAREEMKNVRITRDGLYRVSRDNAKHTHIYAVNEYHPALQGGDNG